jgi:hypothetical protein
MAKGKFPFERSKGDVEPKGGPKEGSRAEEAMDRRQMGTMGKMPKGKMPAFKRGGKVSR